MDIRNIGVEHLQNDKVFQLALAAPASEQITKFIHNAKNACQVGPKPNHVFQRRKYDVTQVKTKPSHRSITISGNTYKGNHYSVFWDSDSEKIHIAWGSTHYYVGKLKLYDDRCTIRVREAALKWLMKHNPPFKFD